MFNCGSGLFGDDWLLWIIIILAILFFFCNCSCRTECCCER